MLTSRHLNLLAIYPLLGALGLSDAFALTGSDLADCKRLTTVKEWKGTYSLKGAESGSGSFDSVGGVTTFGWNYNSSFSAQMTIPNYLNDPILCEFMAPADDYFYSNASFSNATATATAHQESTWPANNGTGEQAHYTYDWVANNSNPVLEPLVASVNFSRTDKRIEITPPDVGHLEATKTVVDSVTGNEVIQDPLDLGHDSTYDNIIAPLPTASSTSLAITGSRMLTANPIWGGVPDSVRGKTGKWIETWELLPIFQDGSTEQPKPKRVEDPCLASGSIIGCENRSLGEAISLTGTPYRLYYQSSRTPGYRGSNNAEVAYAKDLGGWTLDVHHHYDSQSNTLFMGNGALRSAASLGVVTPSAASGFLIASEEGHFVYEFAADGRHLNTRHGLTGAPLLTFSYDPHGGLLSVTDGSANTTTFSRSAAGKLTAVVSPYGQISTVTLNKQGYLAKLKDPSGKSSKAKYTAQGLLTAFTNARGITSKFAYNGNGFLLQDKNAAGGVQTFAANAAGDQVTRTTALGRTSQFNATVSDDGSVARQIVEPSGSVRTFSRNAQLSTTVTSSDGLQIAMSPLADTRFGMSAAVPETYTFTTPQALVNTIGASRVSSLGDAGNPFSLTEQTETLDLNGKKFTSHYQANAKNLTEIAPSGKAATTEINDQGRIVSESVPGLSPVNYGYDTRGRLIHIDYGGDGDRRSFTYGYDANGFISTITNPLGQVQTFSRDALGRVLQQTLPDGNVLKFKYDPNGNLLKLRTAANQTYGFGYNKIDKLSTLTLPAIKGAKNKERYVYNLDGQLTQRVRRDKSLLTYDYGQTGRLSALSGPGRSWSFEYDAQYGYLAKLAVSTGISQTFVQDGPLLTQLAWSGPVAGQVRFSYNNDFQIQSIQVNNAEPIAYSYDADGLLSAAGELSIQRSSDNALRNGSTLGGVQDSYTYNGFGEVTHYQASFNGNQLLSITYARDKLGRITRLTESVQGETEVIHDYAYDAAGRLQQVGSNTGKNITYSYDNNGNRLTDSDGNTGVYDAQDRLLSYGANQFTYTPTGELTTQREGTQIRSFAYDPLGNLVAVVTPTATIDYLVDGSGLRIGKKVNGALVKGLLYQDGLKPVAELDGAGQIVSRFVYATRVNVPDYLIRDGVAYRIITDHLGSPRLVVNSTTGAIAQRLAYDEFGKVLEDTAPGFQPFGFAGGLYDADVSLIHYGAREFDPQFGRWTAPDPILFSGNSLNAYANLNDPVNTVDPSGREGFWAGVGTAISNFLHNKFSSVKAGPVSVSTETGKVSVGGSAEVAAGDVSLIEVSAEASLEVDREGSANDVLVGEVSIGAKQPWLAKLPVIGKIFCGDLVKEKAKISAFTQESIQDKLQQHNRAWEVSER